MASKIRLAMNFVSVSALLLRSGCTTNMAFRYCSFTCGHIQCVFDEYIHTYIHTYTHAYTYMHTYIHKLKVLMGLDGIFDVVGTYIHTVDLIGM